MSPRRVSALIGKELRSIKWLVVIFSLLAAELMISSAYVNPSSEEGSKMPIAVFAGVLALASLFLAERQGGDIGNATKKHLATFPLRPGEIVTGKLLAFLLALVPLTLLGWFGYVGAAAFRPSQTVSPLELALAFPRVVAFAVVFWALEFFVSAWPGVGHVTVIGGLVSYASSLFFFPVMRNSFNIIFLIFPNESQIRIAGPFSVALLLVILGLTLTGLSLQLRQVEYGGRQ